MTSDLITRLSKLDRPDREVDALIIKHLGLEDECPFWLQRLTRLSPMRLTASVDAAIALAERVLPDAVARRLIIFNSSPAKAGFDGTPEKGKLFYFEAATPAIAAVIAILRAKGVERTWATSTTKLRKAGRHIEKAPRGIRTLIRKAAPNIGNGHLDGWMKKLLGRTQTMRLPMPSKELIENVARELCLSYGQDPDVYASLCDICGPNNEPLPQWHIYTEQAETAVYTILAASPLGEQNNG